MTEKRPKGRQGPCPMADLRTMLLMAHPPSEGLFSMEKFVSFVSLKEGTTRFIYG